MMNFVYGRAQLLPGPGINPARPLARAGLRAPAQAATSKWKVKWFEDPSEQYPGPFRLPIQSVDMLSAVAALAGTRLSLLAKLASRHTVLWRNRLSRWRGAGSLRPRSKVPDHEDRTHRLVATHRNWPPLSGRLLPTGSCDERCGAATDRRRASLRTGLHASRRWQKCHPRTGQSCLSSALCFLLCRQSLSRSHLLLNHHM